VWMGAPDGAVFSSIRTNFEISGLEITFAQASDHRKPSGSRRCHAGILKPPFVAFRDGTVSAMTTRDNKQLLTDIFASLADGDARPLTEAMAEGFRWRFAGEWSGFATGAAQRGRFARISCDR